MDGFSTPDLCRLAGLTYRIADYWHRIGVLRPEICVSRGPGTIRRYSPRDVQVATILNVLREHGARTEVLRSVAHRLEGRLDSGMVFVSKTGDVARVAPARWACWWTIDLGQLAGDTTTTTDTAVA